MKTVSGAPCGEQWRCVAGNGGYEVSDLGAVRSVETGAALIGDTDRKGYRRVLLGGRHRRVNRLVCEAFHGAPPSGSVAAHLNGVRIDNRAANLAWASPRENSSHKIAHGTHQSKQKHPRAMLSAEQVEEIRASQLGHRPLARVMGVGESHIRKIRKGERW